MHAIDSQFIPYQGRWDGDLNGVVICFMQNILPISTEIYINFYLFYSQVHILGCEVGLQLQGGRFRQRITIMLPYLILAGHFNPKCGFTLTQTFEQSFL